MDVGAISHKIKCLVVWFTYYFIYQIKIALKGVLTINITLMNWYPFLESMTYNKNHNMQGILSIYI